MPRRTRDPTTRRRVRDPATRRRLIGTACRGCCPGVAPIRPRLCPSPDGDLSGAVGAADEGSAIGLQVSSMDAAGSFFCWAGNCYYVPSTPDYWDSTAIAGTDFRVVTAGEFDRLTQYASCDLCPCAQPLVGPCFSGGSTLTLSYTADNSFVSNGHGGVQDRRDLTEITGTIAWVGGNCGTVPVWQGTVTRRVRHWEASTLTSDVTDTFTTTIAIRAPIAGCPYPNYVAGSWSEPLQHVNGVATDPCTTTTIAVTAECTGGSDELVTTSTNSFGTTTDTVTYDLSVSENTCCDLCDRNLFRKCEYVWDCVNATGTVRPLWQRCMTGAVTHDWPRGRRPMHHQERPQGQNLHQDRRPRRLPRPAAGHQHQPPQPAHRHRLHRLPGRAEVFVEVLRRPQPHARLDSHRHPDPHRLPPHERLPDVAVLQRHHTRLHLRDRRVRGGL
jgi:hypothetical protein